MLKPRKVKIYMLLCSQPFVSSFASGIQPTALSVVIEYIFIEKKSENSELMQFKHVQRSYIH